MLKKKRIYYCDFERRSWGNKKRKIGWYANIFFNKKEKYLFPLLHFYPFKSLFKELYKSQQIVL